MRGPLFVGAKDAPLQGGWNSIRPGRTRALPPFESEPGPLSEADFFL
jgi:hypothetical protein